MKNKIVLAFDSFKGSLSSLEAGCAAADAIRSVIPETPIEIVTVSDGGEGMTEAVVNRLGGKYISVNVSDPAGGRLNAVYGICGDRAIIETAAASGLTLLPADRRNPWLTTSFGTGELIRDAIGRGCRNFLIGLGGSATNDAGCGMLKALGYRFLDNEGKETGSGGGETGRIVRIDTSEVMPELKECTFTIACDVTNPLTGSEGASLVFGPQKGANGEMAIKLDYNLSSFARVTAAVTGKDLSRAQGAGAAGGLGFAFLSFLDAELKPGIDTVLDVIGFNNILKDARLVFTGEGCIDRQTLMGKAPFGIMRRAQRQRVPVIALGGRVDDESIEALLSAGFAGVRQISDKTLTQEEAMMPEVAKDNLKNTVIRILRNYLFLD